MSFGPISEIVIQGNNFCNLNCSYCYLSETERKKSNTLSLDSIDTIFEKVFQSQYIGDSLRIYWHVGEPLTLPIHYFKQAIHQINKLNEAHGISLKHGISTNGTLITQEWCDFFKEYEDQLYVSFSCDGPLHDVYRKDWHGKGTLEKTLEGFRLFHANNLPIKVLATVTPESMEDPQGFLEFFLDHSVTSIGLNPIEKLAANQNNILDQSSYEKKYTQFLEYLLNALTNCSKPIQIREFHTFYEILFKYQSMDYATLLDAQSTPLKMLHIDHDGNFTTFSPQLLGMTSKEYGENFLLGNLLTDNLDSAINTKKFQQIYSDIQVGIKACQNTCDYFQVCGGGSPANKYSETGTFHATETTHCKFKVQIPRGLALQKLNEAHQQSLAQRC